MLGKFDSNRGGIINKEDWIGRLGDGNSLGGFINCAWGIKQLWILGIVSVDGSYRQVLSSSILWSNPCVSAYEAPILIITSYLPM